MAASLSTPIATARDLLDRGRFRVLLIWLILVMVAYPFLVMLDGGATTSVLMIGAVFVGALYATDGLVGMFRLGGGLAVLWTALAVAAVNWPDVDLRLGLVAVSILLAIVVVWSTFVAMFREAKADRDSLAGAMFGYFLLAILWAEIYRAVEIWSPGSFAGSGAMDVGREMLYLSLVTITTLGYGDVLPISSTARMLCGLEAAFGTLYVAILIGRIVGALKRPKPAPGRTSAKAAPPAEPEG